MYSRCFPLCRLLDGPSRENVGLLLPAAERHICMCVYLSMYMCVCIYI